MNNNVLRMKIIISFQLVLASLIELKLHCFLLPLLYSVLGQPTTPKFTSYLLAPFLGSLINSTFSIYAYYSISKEVDR